MHIKLHKASRTSKYRSRGETVHAIVEFKKNKNNNTEFTRGSAK